jgi:Zn-finger nucleic acid-binding protein
MILTYRFCVELDKCPECEGIWLDCGEIEKIAAKNNIGNELYERNCSILNNQG